MRIELVTEGGFAAIPGLAKPVIYDDAAAPPALRSEVEGLVAAALAEQRNTLAAKPSNFPDARRYLLTIERDGKRDMLVACDSTVPPGFRALRNFVMLRGVR